MASTPSQLSPPVSAYLHQRAIVIDHTKVPNTDQINFPVLIAGTFPYLATTANGGQLASPNGYDIVFSSDCAGANLLSYEVESYNPATGAASIWVSVPTVSHTADTVIYMLYGNTAIATSQAAPAAVWDSNFEAVYHLNAIDGTVLADSTANAQNLTNNGAAAAPGIAAGAMNYNGSTYSAIDDGNFPTGSAPITMEAWVKLTSSQNGEFVGLGDNNNHRFGLSDGANNTIGAEFEQASQAVGFVPDGAWHHVAATLPSGNTVANVLLYFDGVLQAPITSNGGFAISTNNTEFSIGRIPTVGFTGYYTGLVDEVRVSKITRSSDWIATEFANISSPSTFLHGPRR